MSQIEAEVEKADCQQTEQITKVTKKKSEKQRKDVIPTIQKS